MHDKYTPEQLFNLIDSKFKKNYVVGCSTNGLKYLREAEGHAYSVLGVYNVTLDDRKTTVKLIRYFNPWHREIWATNPWADDSRYWTDFVKSQVPYLNANDGISFSTIEDFHVNFGMTEWAEINDSYDVSFIDIAFNYDDLMNHYLEFNFTYYGDPGQDLHIYIDQSDSRLSKGCLNSVSIDLFTVFDQNGKRYLVERSFLKIENAPVGMYLVKLNVRKNHNHVKYFTVTAYSQEGKINFIPPANNTIIDLKKKKCPGNCNLQGSCNTAEGKCRCYFGVIYIFKIISNFLFL